MLQPILRDFASVPSADQAAAEMPAAPPIVLGLTTILFSLHHAGYFPFGGAALGTGLFYGALSLIATGLAAWKKHQPFGTVFGTALGLFWLSLIALVVLPETGFGRAPQPASLSSYLALWGVFTSILFTGASRISRELLVSLAMFAIFLLLLAFAAAANSDLLNALAGGEGIACGLAGVYAGIARLKC